MIHSVAHLTHNIMNKKSYINIAIQNYIADFKNNSSFSSTESHQEILPDYEDLITSLAQYSSKSSSFSRTFPKPVLRV